MPGGKKQSYTWAFHLINKESPDYHVGVWEGRHQERGDWIQALSRMKEIDESLLGRIIGEVAKLYEGEG